MVYPFPGTPFFMANDYFQFKQFIIRQSDTAMKVGTDGVLLGAWADIRQAESILDIGTGTGLIALMAAQRNPEAIIDAIEIDADAYRQACQNISESPWNNRIRLFHQSVFDFQPATRYDCILCNPPFFINSTKTPDSSRTLARHCDFFSHARLLETASHLLAPEGKLYVILPVAEALLLLQDTTGGIFSPGKITRVYPNPSKAPKRYLIEFVKIPTETITDDLVLELERHKLSEGYKALAGDFYLNL